MEYKILYELEEYKDGNNLCFSIIFYKEDGEKEQTSWFNDNHEFGDEDRSRECSIKLAEWYLEDPWRIEMIDSGYNHPEYFKYKEVFNSFVKTLYEKQNI